jgi:hypothetical protein
LEKPDYPVRRAHNHRLHAAVLGGRTLKEHRVGAIYQWSTGPIAIAVSRIAVTGAIAVAISRVTVAITIV